jgi:DNA-binding transcriptional LysR family regulator
MLPQSNDITYFLEVAKSLNISRAAERLGVTQPTLSVAIRRLEDSLGTPLLLREKTGVQLTRAGKRFAVEARTLMDHWGRLKSASLEDETEVRGRVTIGCHSSVALYTVGRFAGELARKYPEVELEFHHDLSRRITERVISFETDIGIVVNPVRHPELRIVQLFDDEVGLWRSTGPCAEDVLICDPDLLQAQDIQAKLGRSGGVLKFRRHIFSSSLEVITQLVASGAGIGILPARVAEREKGLQIKRVAPKGPTFHDKCCLIYRPDAHTSAAVRAVAQGIREALAEERS